MTLAEVDEALVRMRTDRDRITENLLDLENSVGYRFLNGGTLHGDTERRWQETSRDIAQLWQLFDAYQRVLNAAVAKRDSQRRPAPSDLQELTDLLHGASIEVPWETGGLADRSLLDSRRKHITPQEALNVMVATFGRATSMIAGAEAAWNVLHPRLREVEERHEEAVACATELGDTPEDLAALSAELDTLRSAVRGDPLALVHPTPESEPDSGAAGAPSGVEIADASEFDHLRDRLGEVRERLATAVSLRDSAAVELRAVHAEANTVIAVARAASEQRQGIRARIAVPNATEVPDAALELEPRLRELDRLHAERQWEDLALRLWEARRSIESLTDAVHAASQTNAGLLRQRDELRGRLDAYRVKAARLGRAETERVRSAQREAERLLWEAPCDLHAAAQAVEQYQRALNERA